MYFNSIAFAIFLPTVFCLYWFVVNKNLKVQNLFLIAASYFFYGWWDWRFLSLIIFSSFVDYFVGLGLAKSDEPRKRKDLLLISIFVNIGLLAVFKYFDFFSESFAEALMGFGYTADPFLLKVMLPVGISFYTFQTLSYSIDVYRRKLEPTRDAVAFFAFVCFFPQLVAGPIERATELLPQFYQKRKFEYAQAVDGMRQILWGLFKKIVIADNCAMYVNEIFENYQSHSGSVLLLGAFFFAIQIYCDFSGYSDIAIGTSRLFGFKLMRNFAFPYFSRDIAEFWRRWHISLSTWFRDYVYIPLGGSRGGTWMKVRNTLIIFVVSGFWHGAKWTFIAWGILNALYFLPLLLSDKNRVNTDTVAQGRWLPSLKEFLQMSLTFSLTLIAWVFFRAKTLSDAFSYLEGMFSASLFEMPDAYYYPRTSLLLFILVEWLQRDKQHALQLDSRLLSWQPLRWTIYIFLIFSIYYLGSFENHAFIYFQF